jgi:hypothetical protein
VTDRWPVFHGHRLPGISGPEIGIVESGSLQKEDAEIIKAMANAVKVLSRAVNDKAVSIKKLMAMVFGPKTEKKKKLSNPVAPAPAKKINRFKKMDMAVDLAMSLQALKENRFSMKHSTIKTPAR